MILSFDAGFPTGSDQLIKETARKAFELVDMIKVNLNELRFWISDINTVTDNNTDYPFRKTKPVFNTFDAETFVMERLSETICGANSEHRNALETELCLDQISDQARRLLRQCQAKLVAVTLGSRGSLMVTKEFAEFCPALNVDSVSSIGAGDGFIVGLLDGLTKLALNSPDNLGALYPVDWQQLGRRGNAAGAYVTTQSTTALGMPTADMLKSLLGSLS